VQLGHETRGFICDGGPNSRKWRGGNPAEYNPRKSVFDPPRNMRQLRRVEESVVCRVGIRNIHSREGNARLRGALRGVADQPQCGEPGTKEGWNSQAHGASNRLCSPRVHRPVDVHVHLHVICTDTPGARELQVLPIRSTESEYPRALKAPTPDLTSVRESRINRETHSRVAASREGHFGGAFFGR
jgi:hypothetical protein